MKKDSRCNAEERNWNRLHEIEKEHIAKATDGRTGLFASGVVFCDDVRGLSQAVVRGGARCGYGSERAGKVG